MNKILKLLRPLMLAAMVAMMALLLLPGSQDRVMALIPQSPLPAVLVLMVLYAMKGATVVFPLLALQVAVGHLFSTPVALLVNMLGVLVTLSVPYWIGYFTGAEMVDTLLQKYPRMQGFVELQRENATFLCFILRTIYYLPGDVGSMYFGAVGMPFGRCLFAGALGAVPGVVLATLLGSKMQDPTSPVFWGAALLMVVLGVVCTAFYALYKKHHQASAAQTPSGG